MGDVVETSTDFGVSKITSDPEFDLENKRLIKQIQETGSVEAKEKLIKRCRGFVHNIVVSLMRKFGSLSDYDDLMQEGCIGVLIAAERFDVTSEVTFFTYAAFWIRQGVLRYRDSDHTVRIPVHKMEMIKKLLHVDNRNMHLNAKARIEADADALGIKVKDVEDLIIWSKRFLTLPSFNQPLLTDNFGEIVGGNIVKSRLDEDVSLEEECVSSILFDEMVSAIRALLPDREWKVFSKRVGIIDGVLLDEGKTLEEIGKELGVTRERIRQIEGKACRRTKYMLRFKFGITDY